MISASNGYSLEEIKSKNPENKIGNKFLWFHNHTTATGLGITYKFRSFLECKDIITRHRGNVSNRIHKNHKKAHQTSKKQPEPGLKYQNLDMNAFHILVFSDGFFSGINDGSSQYVYNILIVVRKITKTPSISSLKSDEESKDQN